MNGPNGLPNNCKSSIKFMNRFALKPTLFTRAKGECITCDYTTIPGATGPGCPFTEEQLNMRRKAEVLQYKNNSNFTGALTKAEKYSLIARRKGPNQKTYGTQTQTYTNPNSLDPGTTNPLGLPPQVAYNNINPIPSNFTPASLKNCPLVRTSTHGSDVPGPEMNLFLDNSIPLTNYVVSRNYSGNHGRTNFIFKPKTTSIGGKKYTYFEPSTD